MSARSSRAEARNPLLSLPSSHALRALDERLRFILRALLLESREDARARAADSWRR